MPARSNDAIDDAARDAAEWGSVTGEPQGALTTRELLQWAFVTDPSAWNRAADAVGPAHPDDIAIEALEPIVRSRIRNGLPPMSSDAATAMRIARQLADQYELRPDATLLGFAATLVLESWAHLWATQEKSPLGSADALAAELFGASLSGLADLLDLSNKPRPGRIILVSPQRYRAPVAVTVVMFSVLHFALNLHLIAAASLAIMASFALPDLTTRQQRRRLSLLEVGAAVGLLAVSVIAITSVVQAVNVANALTTLHRAEDEFRHGNAEETLRLLKATDSAVAHVPRLHVTQACAGYESGYQDYAFAQLQLAFFLGLEDAVASELPGCFVNSAAKRGQLVFVTAPLGTLVVLPKSDPNGWHPKAMFAFGNDRYGDGLVASACAQHWAGNRLTAAILLTFGVNRLPIDASAADPLGELVSRKSGISSGARSCIRELATTGQYELRRLSEDKVFIRTRDFRTRIP